MKLEDFKKAIEDSRKFERVIDIADTVGIDLVESKLSEAFWDLERILFTEAYGVEGYDWIEWYLYDCPNRIDGEGQEGEEAMAHDADGNPIDFSSDEKLWQYLEKEYKTKKE